MKEVKLEIGSVVLSKKGRDSGNYFMVVSVASDNVTIADGERHKLNSPKTKNIKHVEPNGQVLSVIAEKLVTDKKVFDSEVRSALKVYNADLKD